MFIVIGMLILRTKRNFMNTVSWIIFTIYYKYILNSLQVVMVATVQRVSGRNQNFASNTWLHVQHSDARTCLLASPIIGYRLRGQVRRREHSAVPKNELREGNKSNDATGTDHLDRFYCHGRRNVLRSEVDVERSIKVNPK